MDMDIKFDMGGVATVEQTITIPSDFYAPLDVLEGLKTGSIVTSIAKGGGVFDLDAGFKRIGNVTECTIDHNLEYSEFEIS